MDQPQIGISLGDNTEAFLQKLLESIDDATLDELKIDRELKVTYGLAGEPITAGVIIGGSAIIISAVLRLLERNLEHKQQLKMMHIVAEGFSAHPGLGVILADIAKKNAEVSISFGVAKEAWAKNKREQ